MRSPTEAPPSGACCSNLKYNLQSSSDLIKWTSDATGHCEKLVNLSGNAFFRYTYAPRPAP
jgi:hypothetical protein